jgi:hypothetical protein
MKRQEELEEKRKKRQQQRDGPAPEEAGFDPLARFGSK